MKTIFLGFILIFSISSNRSQAAKSVNPQTRLTTVPVHEKIDLTIVDQESLYKIFNNLASQENIPFAFPERGCEARAHAMSLLLEKEHIKTGKIFITGLFNVNTPNTPLGFVIWRYHVGLTLWVRHPLTQNVETYVIDPSLFNKPVNTHEWVSMQMQNENNRLDRLVLTPSYVYDLNFKDVNSEISYNLANIDMMNESLATYLKAQKERQNNK